MRYSTTISVMMFLTAAAEVFGGGEVIILSKPDNIEFTGHEKCDINTLSDICSTALGFTTYQTKKFSGMIVKNPFHFAATLVVVAVDGVSSVGLKEGHRFPLDNDAPVGDVFNTLESKMYERFPVNDVGASWIDLNEDINKVEYSLNKGSLKLRKDSESYLKSDEEEEYVSKMNHQLSMLDAISDKVVQEESLPKEKGLPEIMWIKLTGLHPIVDFYGESSTTAALARDSIESSVMRMKEKFDYAHPNKTMIVLVASDSAHTRRFRRAAADSEFVRDHNIADTYDENYPVFFNIFFWFTIAFIMTIIATSMVTAGMDPGRDSIIYRMTSTRMKKDV